MSEGKKNRAALVAAVVVVVVVMVVGLTRGCLDSQPPSAVPQGSGPTITTAPPASGEPAPPSSSTSTEEELERGDGAEETPTAPAPTNQVSNPGGTDHDHDEETAPAEEIPALLERSNAFWTAFSLRDPAERDEALAEVAVPYLAKRMSVPSTERIPEVEPVRAAVVSGSFSTAVVVSEAADGAWWYVGFVYDPSTERWGAQEYERASPRMISDAQAQLDDDKKEEGS